MELGKSILSRQKSTNKPSLEKIKGQYAWTIESKRKSGTGWGRRRGEQGQGTRGNYGLVLEISDFISPPPPVISH